MQILFLTIFRIKDISERGIYTDLIRKFRDEGHEVYVVSPTERRYKEKTAIIVDNGVHLLNVRTLNLQKSNLIEKGIGNLLIEVQYKLAIKKYFTSIKFDLVLYSTPPISFTRIISEIKRKNNAKSYLLLKDIFPQNAVDLDFIKEGCFIHRYFRIKERMLYEISDYIGCMSEANKNYLLKQNPQIDPGKIEINPNSITPNRTHISLEQKQQIRKKFGLPSDKLIFLYGGNLGKPQGIDFLIDVMFANNKNDIFFLVTGSGTEYGKIEACIQHHTPPNILLISNLPKQKYDELVQCCDVGLIFLDKRFTIPNYPSRLLSYLEYKMPIIAATDKTSDIGKDAENNAYGFWCESGDLHAANRLINTFINDNTLIDLMGNNGYNYLCRHFTVDISYQIIMNHFK